MSVSANSLLFIGMGLGLAALAFPSNPNPLGLLEAEMAAREGDSHKTRQALELRHLLKQTLWLQMKTFMDNLKAQVGTHLPLKLLALAAVAVAATLALTDLLPDWPLPLLFLTVLLILTIMAIRLLQIIEKRLFATSFPDALNLLTSAISSGESLMHAIVFVGDALKGSVGREFKLMGQRLSMGQNTDEVLKKSCQRFPYPPFYFFAITLRANINRGGQLKEVIRRLNRVMFNSRALDKKKSAMTSEARASAKIVAAIPFLFILLMKYMTPENFDFVMYHDAGRPVLYYVLISETLGLGIIWLLMRRVQG